MISTKGRYALRVMLDLAEHENGGPVPLRDIAERQEISKKYLEIILRDLVKNGLLSASSGKGGGYALTKAPADYSVYEILEGAGESLAVVACLCRDAAVCPRAAGCRTLPFWSEFDGVVRDFLSSRRLTDVG